MSNIMVKVPYSTPEDEDVYCPKGCRLIATVRSSRKGLAKKWPYFDYDDIVDLFVYLRFLPMYEIANTDVNLRKLHGAWHKNCFETDYRYYFGKIHGIIDAVYQKQRDIMIVEVNKIFPQGKYPRWMKDFMRFYNETWDEV